MEIVFIVFIILTGVGLLRLDNVASKIPKVLRQIYPPPPPTFPAPKKKEIITNKPLQHPKVTASSETYWTKGIENFNLHSLKWRGSAFLDYAFFYRLLQSSIILSSLILSDPRIIKNNTCVIRFYSFFHPFALLVLFYAVG